MTEYYAAVRIIEKATLKATWVVLKNRSKKVRNRVPGSVSHTLNKAIKPEQNVGAAN